MRVLITKMKLRIKVENENRAFMNLPFKRSTPTGNRRNKTDGNSEETGATSPVETNKLL